MKICLINNIYPPYHRGGAEQVVVKTARGLIEQGYEVVVITSAPEGNYVERDGQLTIHRVHPKNLYFYTKGHEHNFGVRFFWHLIDIFNFQIAGQVKEILTEEKPNLVHTHNLMGLSFLIPRVIRKLKFRHIHTVHDVQLVEPSGLILKKQETSWRYNGLPTRAYTWLMKKLMGSPDVVISPSQFLLGFYKDRGFFNQSKFVVVRNPLTLNIGQEVPKMVSEQTRFLYLGQVEEHKGLRVLVESFKDLEEQNWKLTVVGSGSLLSEIKNLSKGDDRIQVLGRKSREALPGLFRQTDVTIVPSLCYENSPTVIFESLLFGVPVLASHIEGIAELISEGENGLTFEAGSKSDLQTKIKWCLEHKGEIRSMGVKAGESVKSSSPERYVENLFQLYRG